MTTPTTQREADERAQKALAAITERLALTYRICCGTSPKQSVGELLDMTINMPEWEVVRAAIDQSASPAVCGPIRITVEHGCVTHVGYTSTTARFPDGIHELWPAPVAAPEATDHKQMLSNLLARIHRDGGHREAEIGTEAAVAEADIIIAELNAMKDAQQVQAVDVARDAARYRFIEEHATMHGGGNGFTITCFVGVDEEDMGIGIDRMLESRTNTTGGSDE